MKPSKHVRILEQLAIYLLPVKKPQKAFNELISEGRVKNLAASRKRPVHAVHFDEEEFLKRLNS